MREPKLICWMQTFVTHTRSPARLIREAGFARAAAAMLLVAGALIGPMFGPAFALAFAARGLPGDAFAPRGFAGACAAALWFAVCLGGLASALWPALLGLRRRGLPQLALWLPLLPLYWALLSIAAWWALADFIRDPFHWAKTDHGHAKTSWRRDTRRPDGAVNENPCNENPCAENLRPSKLGMS